MPRATATVSFQAIELQGSLLPASLLEQVAPLQAPLQQQEDDAALAERRADLAEEDHRRVREASLRSGEALRIRFRCEPSLPVDVIGLIVLLPASVL